MVGMYGAFFERLNYSFSYSNTVVGNFENPLSEFEPKGKNMTYMQVKLTIEKRGAPEEVWVQGVGIELPRN